MWTGDELHLTDEAKAVALAIAFEIAMPRYLHPSRKVHNLVLLGTLPARVRKLFGLCWSTAHAVAFTSVVAGMRAARPITLPQLRRGANTASFDMVERTEKAMVASGRATLPSNAAAIG